MSFIEDNPLKKSFKVGEMFGNGKESLDIQQHNLNSDQYREEITKNMESISYKFKQINKSMSDLIKKDELLDFLDNIVNFYLKLLN